MLISTLPIGNIRTFFLVLICNYGISFANWYWWKFNLIHLLVLLIRFQSLGDRLRAQSINREVRAALLKVGPALNDIVCFNNFWIINYLTFSAILIYMFRTLFEHYWLRSDMRWFINKLILLTLWRRIHSGLAQILLNREGRFWVITLRS